MPAMPGCKLEECVCAQQKRHRTVFADFIPELYQCVIGIAGPNATRFPVIDNKTIVPGNRESRHRNAVLWVGARTCAMRWRAARQEMYFRKLCLVGNFLRQPQMPVMHRIEGAAK